MGEHTPGPWTLDEDAITDSDGDRWICQGFDKCEGLFENWEANARLIAAAPQLLGALESFKREISRRFANDNDMTPETRRVVMKARAAIAAAKGEINARSG